MEQEQFQALVLDQFNKIDQKFMNIDEQFRLAREELTQFRNETHDSFSQIRGDIKDIRYEMRGMQKQLDDVYQARNSVKIKFGFAWAAMSLLIAIIASGITQVFRA